MAESCRNPKESRDGKHLVLNVVSEVQEMSNLLTIFLGKIFCREKYFTKEKV